ncbi:MAG: AAA family ATPase [Candidatus Lokiarchaeota archaeon]|nr:AAA family ATPase [Candidatus Lokiarchaeota archaeon]
MEKQTIAFSGKGGVGKSTLLVLLLKILSEGKKYENSLVIDADPDSNVGDLLNYTVKFENTISGKMVLLKRKIEKREIPITETKDRIIENDVFESLIEFEKFDLLELGHSKTKGCYCSINNFLKNIIENLAKNYDIVLMDCPAGLEHFSRLTSKSASDLVIVVDPSKMSFHTLERILDISNSLELNFGKLWILGNRFNEKAESILNDKIKKINNPNLNLLGILPFDDKISEFNLTDSNLLEISSENIFYKEFKDLINQSGILR